MEVLAQAIKCYRVEVSGWDARDNFFVEKTTLEWGHGAEIAIRLRSALREGCMLFVRLLSSVSSENHCPITYLAARIEESESTGLKRVGLVPLRPNISSGENAPTLEGRKVQAST